VSTKRLLRDPSAAFYTTGDGLRGVPVMLMDRDTGALEYSRVYSNTATTLTLDTPLSRTPDNYDAYILGSIPIAIESGDLIMGNPRAVKNIFYFTFEFPAVSDGNVDLYFAADQSNQVEAAWSRVGGFSMKGRTYYRMAVGIAAGTGRVIRYLVMATLPGQETEFSHMSVNYEVRDSFSG